MNLKTIEIVAGPNGSGKSTFAESYLVSHKKTQSFMNPDILAAGLSPFNSELSAFHAGRIMLTSVKSAIERGESFAFESTLSGRTWLPILKNASLDGYQIVIYFLYLKNVNANIQRIAKRVQMGGHHIPNADVKRRYPKTFSNFWNLYRPLCSDWWIFDNSGTKPKTVISKSQFESLREVNQSEFELHFLKRRRNEKKD